MVKVYIGLGSNLGDSRAILRAAYDAVAFLGFNPRISTLYRSSPIGGPSQPPYLNAVMSLETSWRPEQLLQMLHRIEERFGRHRRERWGARRLDLDLLLYGNRMIATPDLVVPHPRMLERRFVLEPLAELAPDLVIPGNHGLQQALREVSHQEVERIHDPFGTLWND